MKRSMSLLFLILIMQLSSLSTAAQSKQQVELAIQTGHPGWVSSVEFSPDGRMLASSGNNIINLWNVGTGQQLKTLVGHTDSVSTAVFSPDGKTLASGSSDKTIKLWKVETGRLIKTLTGHTGDVSTVTFSPDGNMLASAGDDRTILWDVESGQLIKSLKGHARGVSATVFSPDGNMLASVCSSETIELWNVEAGQLIKIIEASRHLISSIAFAPDGKMLATGGAYDKAIRLWDVESGQLVATLTGHGSGYSGENILFGVVSSVVFSPDGKTLVSGSSDRTIKFWSVKTGRQLRSLNSRSGRLSSVTFSPDGETLASGGEESPINLWDVKTGRFIKALASHAGPVWAVSFSLDGRRLASAVDKTIKLWDVEAGRLIKSFKGHAVWVESVAFSPDGETLASGSRDHTIKLWDVETGQLLNSIRGHTSWVTSVAFAPDGETLASGGADGKIKLWNVKTGRLRKVFATQNNLVESVAFSPDGTMLASGDNGVYNSIKLWDVATGRPVKLLKGDYMSVLSVAFSPDGTTLVSGGDKIIKLWDVETGQLTRVLEGHADGVTSVNFSPDGKRLASSSYDKTVRLWDVRTGEQLKTLEDHIDMVESVAFSPDGKFFVSGGRDAVMKLWEGEKNEPLVRLIALGKDDWIVTTADGRFDTNKSLDNVEGLHWIVNDEILQPLPLDVFMRQYYEPGLLQRVLKGEQFKALPSIADINRVQPKVAIKKIKPGTNGVDSVDVVVEVESVTEDISTNATDRTEKKRLASGAFDLRLFRNGQLVGVSTPKDKLAQFINDAPRLINETKALGKLIDTPEERAWREANDIFRLKSENVKFISPAKAEYTFREIKLPHDGRKQVVFTAYAFNSNKVKSTTTGSVNFTVPAAVAKTPKKGRAFVLSIGVNASETPVYDLRYAANDARKMQHVVGARLKANRDKYSAVIQIPLISDYGADKTLTENTAQKAIIKGVFSLLAGHDKEVPEHIIKQIPNRDRIKPVEPEDTLIIAYSGHGYADQAGIFYILPYDIGKDTTKLTAEALQKTISSDELSLWMQDITAAEMIMIIDACHSSAAVQGEGFKPGPMGSRGLGQLAYDKDMKLLSATQADNIALESDRLEQGLLSYALLEDGIGKEFADVDKDKRLFVNELLSFAEKRVPELYQEVKNGRRSVVIDGRSIEGDGSGATSELDERPGSNLYLQSPYLFDFKRRNVRNMLFNLP